MVPSKTYPLSPRTVQLQIRRGQKKSDGSSVSVFMCPKKDMDPAKAVGSAVVKNLLEDFPELDRIFYMYTYRTGTCRSAQLYRLTSMYLRANVLCHHVSFVKLPMFVLSVEDSDSMKPQSLSSSLTMVQHNESSNAWHYSTKTSKQLMQPEAQQ